jgi:hypothetical protein
MKINIEDIKVGYRLLAFDLEDYKWYKAEVNQIEGQIITLTDIDPKSPWQGMIWETNPNDIQDVTLYKHII